MNERQSDTTLGIIKIHKEAIASIASLAALETEGVSRLIKKFDFDIFKFLSKKPESAIKVYIYKNQEIVLDVPLLVKYGYNIPEVAYRVQDNIQLALEKMTNMQVKQINIIVKGVERSQV